MSQERYLEETIDPFKLFNLPVNASDEMVQRAFHSLMKESKNTEELIRAYGMLRDKVSRQHLLWDTFFTKIGDLYRDNTNPGKELDLQALARELAFLSNWETGEDACLT